MQVNLIDLLAFQELFSRAKSMAIIGSSDSVINYDHGKLIDSYDVVVRFNRVNTAEFNAAIGNKTDILVANDGNSLAKSIPVNELSNPRVVISFVSNFGLNKSSSHKKDFFDWVNGVPLLVIPRPHILVSSSSSSNFKSFSMGLYALSWLPFILDIKKLYVSGFTFFGAVSGGTYHHSKPPSFSGSLWHDAELEAQIAKKVLTGFDGEITATEEMEPFLINCKLAKVSIIERDYFRRDIKKHKKITSAFCSPVKYLFYKVAKIFLKLGYLLRRFSEAINC